MRKFLQALLFFLFGLITILALRNIHKYFQKQQQYKYWVECIKTLRDSPDKCKLCDDIFRPEGEGFTMPE